MNLAIAIMPGVCLGGSMSMVAILADAGLLAQASS